ncbi:spore germination protein GerPE [Halobacillus sp. A1]|uniref:spore germination protein GerPE n=1 Tax=Halobacillus sp. A1 TaxID=2880262 RepID=UPI0020A6A49E|nr:spore germination protein GerPE [Halobacillus sp. A1]MCP3032020.1 spore germination protein GerPE [Halobacillus sp. A1]
MNSRMVELDYIDVLAISIGSGFLIGDVSRSNSHARVIAVQEETLTISDKVDFDDFSIFHRELSPPRPSIAIKSSFCSHHPVINVQSMHVKGISTAGLVQVGGVNHIEGESRLKHVRILNEEQ